MQDMSCLVAHDLEKLRMVDTVVTLNPRNANVCTLCEETWPSIGMAPLPNGRDKHCPRDACEVEASLIREVHRDALADWVPSFKNTGRTGRWAAGSGAIRLLPPVPGPGAFPTHRHYVNPPYQPPVQGRCRTILNPPYQPPMGNMGGKSLAVARNMAAAIQPAMGNMIKAYKGLASSAAVTGNAIATITGRRRQGRRTTYNMTIQGQRHDLVTMDDLIRDNPCQSPRQPEKDTGYELPRIHDPDTLLGACCANMGAASLLAAAEFIRKPVVVVGIDPAYGWADTIYDWLRSPAGRACIIEEESTQPAILLHDVLAPPRHRHDRHRTAQVIKRALEHRPPTRRGQFRG